MGRIFQVEVVGNTKYCINFDVLCLLRLFWLTMVMYKQILNCDQFASSKQCGTVMHLNHIGTKIKFEFLRLKYNFNFKKAEINILIKIQLKEKIAIFAKKMFVYWKKSDRFHRRRKIEMEFWIAWKLEQKNFGNKPKIFWMKIQFLVYCCYISWIVSTLWLFQDHIQHSLMLIKYMRYMHIVLSTYIKIYVKSNYLCTLCTLWMFYFVTFSKRTWARLNFFSVNWIWIKMWLFFVKI